MRKWRHGWQITCESGRGDGPATTHLGVESGVLTKLSASNDGEYPFLKVFHIVDGRQEVGAHGSRTMPVWGKRYPLEAAENDGPFGAEEVVRGRILDIVY